MEIPLGREVPSSLRDLIRRNAIAVLRTHRKNEIFIKKQSVFNSPRNLSQRERERERERERKRETKRDRNATNWTWDNIMRLNGIKVSEASYAVCISLYSRVLTHFQPIVCRSSPSPSILVCNRVTDSRDSEIRYFFRFFSIFRSSSLRLRDIRNCCSEQKDRYR